MNDNQRSGMSGFWRRAVDYVRDRRQALWTMRELEALDRNEATRILAEAGLARADVREAVSRPFAFEDLMSKGMDSIGIDAHDFAVRKGDWYRSLEHTCAKCQVRGRCRRVIACSQFAERFHEFCPNSEDFDQILAAKSGGSKSSGPTREPGSGHVAYIN
mgnify:CR=1 FL=1